MGEPLVRTWFATQRLRWRRPPHTTTAHDVLEAAWQCVETGAVEWRAVPIYVEKEAQP